MVRLPWLYGPQTGVRLHMEHPTMDWENLDLEPLFEVIRDGGASADAERTVGALERARAVARVDGELLRYLLVAAVALVAAEEGETPRAILERTFRRSVSDAEWRDRYAPLLR